MTEHAYERAAALIAALAAKVLAGDALTRPEARTLTEVEGDALYDLFFWANKIRIKHVGRHVKFCSIVAGKVGNCSQDCAFCAQSAHFRTNVTPQTLTVDQMRQATEQAVSDGASSFGVVNSGRGPTDRELDWLEPFFKRTASEHRIRPCATLGELTAPQARRLADMGVLRVNHNLETSRRHFPNIVSTHTYDDRVRTIRNAKAAGLSICSGGIFGMGEDWQDRLDVAFELRDLGADVVPINFLNRIDGTPLHDRCEDMHPMEALKIIALYRFVLPDRELKIAGGREKILRELQSWMFFAGASSFLIGNYLTTFGREPGQDRQMLSDLGLTYRTFDEIEHDASSDPQPSTPLRTGQPLPVLNA